MGISTDGSWRENSSSGDDKAMLIHFNDLFAVADDEILHPKVVIQIDDFVLTPSEFPPLGELTVEGRPLQQLMEEILEVDLEYQNIVVFVVKGIAR